MVGVYSKANVFTEIWVKDFIYTFNETLSASLPSGGLCSIYLSIYLSVSRFARDVSSRNCRGRQTDSLV